MKSTTCFGKATNQPLSVYKTEDSAIEAAQYENLRHGRNFVHYQCRTCNEWHLTPEHRQTPSTVCRYCTGADGKKKHLYPDRQTAQQRAVIIREESYLYLKPYKCPRTEGWHLTKA